MNWSSWGDFFAMGGYATYVWGSYVVTFVIIAVEIVLVRGRARNARDKIARSVKRNAKRST
jgi:heme exporter protein D